VCVCVCVCVSMGFVVCGILYVCFCYEWVCVCLGFFNVMVRVCLDFGMCVRVCVGFVMSGSVYE